MPKIEMQDEKTSLEKKIQEYTQFQWLALMPAWLPGILNLVNRTPTVPGREGYVLMFRVGMLIFGIACFVWVRWQIKKMKTRLEKLENPPVAAPKPPIAAP